MTHQLFVSVTGNLLKHYKERHNGCTLPESLAELDRVTKSVNSLSNVELQDDIQMSERTSENMDEDIKEEVGGFVYSNQDFSNQLRCS